MFWSRFQPGGLGLLVCLMTSLGKLGNWKLSICIGTQKKLETYLAFVVPLFKLVFIKNIRDSWLPHLWTISNTFTCVFSRASFAALQRCLFCVSCYLFFACYDNGPSSDCAFSFKLGNYCILLFWCCTAPSSAIQFVPCQLKREMLALLGTVDNNLFYSLFIFLVCNETGSESYGKTDFSEILIQPPL